MFTQECCFLVPSGPRAVGAVRITRVGAMKGSPDLIPAAGDELTSLIFSGPTTAGHRLLTETI